jgi:hypothetical protein
MLPSRPAGSIHPPASVGAGFSSLPSRTTPAAHPGARPASSGYGNPSHGLLCKPLLRHLSIPSRLRPVGFPCGSAPYPAGTGSAAIRRTMLPKSRRVRWLSANRRQSSRACVISRPPSSPTAAAHSSATTARSSSAAPSAATGSPGYRRSRSATGTPRWTGTDGNSGVSSSPLAFRP